MKSMNSKLSTCIQFLCPPLCKAVLTVCPQTLGGGTSPVSPKRWGTSPVSPKHWGGLARECGGCGKSGQSSGSVCAGEQP